VGILTIPCRHIERLRLYMSDESPEARENFLLVDPLEFFNGFPSVDTLESPLTAPLLAFKANLSSALQVGSVPFQLAHSGVIRQRFNQLMMAERIRSLKTVKAGEPVGEQAAKAAVEDAKRAMRNELADSDVVKRHANDALEVLNQHLRDQDFGASAQELLRQVLVICWGAFEILVNDTMRVLLNERPNIIRAFTDNKTYRDLLSTRVLLEALEAKSFNLSSAMGDLFCDVVKLDSLEKIREASRIALCQSSIDIILKDERLWRISQQRHLIVHRRGLVDARYIERTSDRAMIGEQLKVGAKYTESSLAVVRDAGCAPYAAAQQRLAPLAVPDAQMRVPAGSVA
jgi:hypothetical protein